MGRSVPYKGQVYSKLKRQCVRQNGLFVDGEFPPNGKSLFYSRAAPADIIWKRPREIVSDPKFIAQDASADDFAQGSLGNCWFVAACACIAEDHRLLRKVVPDPEGQEWTDNNKYAGIFHFKFWRCGQWVDVVIDDYLPTRQGQLIFLHSRTRNEFWSALLEKAYAKLFGDYESLTAGKARDAMVDMTGGVGESITMSDHPGQEAKMKLFDDLEEASDNRSLMSASIVAKSASDMEAKLSCGLVKGHAYSITSVKKVRLGKGLLAFFKQEMIYMVRLRNPWGGVEWRGPWSDGSAEWQNVSESQKKELGLTFDDNGEFWMAYDDFCRYFTHLDICHMLSTSYFSLRKTWQEQKEIGDWKKPLRAGGCMNFPGFLKNPQYLLIVNDEKVKLMVSLEQADKRVDKDKGDNNDCIGFTFMQTDLNRKYRMHEKMDKVHSGPFIQSRSTFARVRLEKGRYCVLPSTFNPGEEGRYLLRLYASGSSSFTLSELAHEVPRPPACCGVPYCAATSVTAVRAEGLEKQDTDRGADPYCMFYCEKKQLRTAACEKTLSPSWNARATFYRRKPNEDVIIEVWNANILKDEFMGQVTLKMADANRHSSEVIVRYDLYGKDKEAGQKKAGYLWLRVNHTTDMEQV